MSLRKFSLKNGLLAVVVGLFAALTAVSQPAPAPVVSAADPRAAIAAKFPEVRPEQIAPSPVQGLYEVRIGAKIAYVSADGRYLLQGDLIDIDTDQNLTESRRDGVRRDVLAGVSEAGMIVFAPAKTSSTITVFTDIDCGYCRKLHNQIAGYNARGIKVRYMFFPRSGPGTESWTKAEQVTCAKDRQAALTRAKMGATLNEKACKPNPIAQHYKVGQDFGVQGTPAIILESGELIGGYLDPAELSKYIAGTKVASR